MPVVHQTVGRRVLAHGGQHDPILHRDRSNGKRPEQVWIRIAAQDPALILAGRAGIDRRRHLENTSSENTAWCRTCPWNGGKFPKSSRATALTSDCNALFSS